MSVQAYFPKGVHSAPTSIDYDVVAKNIQCVADVIGARIFEFERNGHVLRVLAYCEESAREAADPIFNDNPMVDVSVDDDSEITCWCGEKGKASEMFDDSDLRGGCGGLGSVICHCGGDLCVCHHHGEIECPGCADCESDDEFDDGEDLP